MNQFQTTENNTDLRQFPNLDEQPPAVSPWSQHTRSNNSSSHHYTNPHHYENSIRDDSFHYYNDIVNDNSYLKTVSARVDGDFDYYFNESPAALKDRQKQIREGNNMTIKSDGEDGSTNYCTVCLWFIAVGFGLYFIPKFLWR